MRLYYDANNIVKIATTKPIITNIYKYVEVNETLVNPIGKRLVFKNNKKSDSIKIAVISNWDDACGISTYTKYLIDALSLKVDDLKIFSEKTSAEKIDNGYNISYCWSRGEPLRELVKQVLEWEPSVVLIQHEYGIFPKTSYVMQMFQSLENIPYVVTMHSVYEHLDKTVASSVMKNIIVHSTTGRDCLRRLGNKNNLWVVPHGCVPSSKEGELWNTWQTPYPIVQFGFGFNYKGVDIALEAISLLKANHGSKYKDIFYTYFCSESPHVKNVNDEYARKIYYKIEELGLEDNAAVIRGYQTEETLNNYLRTSRMALFPYVTDPKNVVYGASGAMRLAMASGTPVIVSASHMFDDIEDVLPRPKNAEELAESIDRIFSDGKYRQGVLDKSASYILNNSWDITADRYLSVLKEVIGSPEEDIIFV